MKANGRWKSNDRILISGLMTKSNSSFAQWLYSVVAAASCTYILQRHSIFSEINKEVIIIIIIIRHNNNIISSTRAYLRAGHREQMPLDSTKNRDVVEYDHR